jgi:ATP-dependent DNA helicase DinG
MKQSALLPDPVELGFPSKFLTWYPDQLTAIDKCILAKDRFVALAMPTGSGKSVTGVASALLHPKVKRAVYLTSTKGLQDQLAADFRELGLCDVRGARNYPCIAVEHGANLAQYRRGRYHGCDEGPCHAGVWCPYAPDPKQSQIRPACLSYGALWDARRAEIVSTNYAMWFAQNHYGQGFGQVDLLILDEAHDADKELESFLTLEITSDDARHIGTKILKSQELSDWRDWAEHHRGNLASTVEQRELHPPKDAEGARDLRHLKTILGKLERLAKIEPLDWCIDRSDMVVRFAPIRVSQYAEEHLFQKIPHVLLMSATMTRKTTQLLGIDPNQLTFWECPSRFPVERRPIICINTQPTVQVRGRMSDDDKYMWMRRIDRFCEPRIELNRKGIIHTVSYQRAKELMARSEHRDWMILHDSGNLKETIQQFKQSSGPWILVSPSIVTGYDFPNDECRYQIIGKVPIPDMRSAIMSVRKDLDPDYSGYLAMVKLIQACGRINRNPLDWGETAIVDDTFVDWFLNKYRKFAARWFLEALLVVESMPEPIDPSTFV